jgi:hypothetical protein
METDGGDRRPWTGQGGGIRSEGDRIGRRWRQTAAASGRKTAANNGPGRGRANGIRAENVREERGNGGQMWAAVKKKALVAACWANLALIPC